MNTEMETEGNHKTLHIFKAKNIGGFEIPSLTIEVAESITDMSLEELQQIYEKNAQSIADALIKALPGGTFDRLVIELMKQKTSMFMVPHVGGGFYQRGR